MLLVPFGFCEHFMFSGVYIESSHIFVFRQSFMFSVLSGKASVRFSKIVFSIRFPNLLSVTHPFPIHNQCTGVTFKITLIIYISHKSSFRAFTFHGLKYRTPVELLPECPFFPSVNYRRLIRLLLSSQPLFSA